MGHDELLTDLRSWFEELKHRSLPRAGEAINLESADVDLFEEDGYLAGLVDSFLTRRVLPVARIVLDESIDQRLENARVTTLEGSRTVSEFLEYRKGMHALAEKLSRASGVPLLRKNQ